VIWTGTPVLDVLTSTGVPVWYDERGSIHAAEAHTWRHITSGRYGTAWSAGYDTSYLPLNPRLVRASRSSARCVPGGAPAGTGSPWTSIPPTGT
jgi:hypothetical protein